jgi:hypothetical protein
MGAPSSRGITVCKSTLRVVADRRSVAAHESSWPLCRNLYFGFEEAKLARHMMQEAEVGALRHSRYARLTNHGRIATAAPRAVGLGRLGRLPYLHAADETATVGLTEVVVAIREEAVATAWLEAQSSVASGELLDRRLDDVLLAVPRPCRTAHLLCARWTLHAARHVDVACCTTRGRCMLHSSQHLAPALPPNYGRDGLGHAADRTTQRLRQSSSARPHAASARTVRL